MFVKRLISAVVLLAIMGIALITGKTFLLLLGMIVSLVAVFELLRAGHMQKCLPGCICYISVVGFYLMLYFRCSGLYELWAAVTLVVMLVSYVAVYPKYHIRDIAICFLFVFYVGVLLSYVYQTRCMAYGKWFVWLIIISASGSDTFAYLTGRLIGKRHFSELSPKKTIEGCIGGVAGAALLAFLYSLFLPEGAAGLFDRNVSLIFVGTAVAGSVISQFGDLAASAVKRNYELKDFGDLIPGHGGVLDRIDSILFAAPLVYYILYGFMY